MFAVRSHPLGNVKYTGRSVAKVIANADPAAKGRIRVHHPLLGESVWIPYLRLAHVFDVPDVDDLVYIECDCGEASHPIAWGNVTKGIGSAELPDKFKRSVPSNIGMFSKGGHFLELDDGTGITGLQQKGIRITTAGGKKFHLMEDLLANNNTMTLEDESGNGLTVDTLLNKIDLKTSSGEMVSLSPLGGALISEPAGSALELKLGALELKSATDKFSISTTGDTTITGAAGTSEIILTSGEASMSSGAGTAKLILKNGQVELKGAADGVVDLIFQLAQALSTDTFSGFGAPATNVATYAQIAIKAQTLKAS